MSNVTLVIFLDHRKISGTAEKASVFKHLRSVFWLRLWPAASGFLIWKIEVPDTIYSSCSLLWDRYEMINQQKCIEHLACATGDSKKNEQNTSFRSSRKLLALEEESTLEIYFLELCLWEWVMEVRVKAIEIVPPAWGEWEWSCKHSGTKL